MAPTEPSTTEGQNSKATEQDDKDFDPAEASIEEIDDERTLEEEEELAAKNKEAVKEELDSLEREAEMPIEELKAHYEKLRKEGGATNDGEEEDDDDDDEDDEDEDGDDDEDEDDDDDDDDVDDDDDDDDDDDEDVDDEGDDEDAENSEDGQNGEVANGKSKKSIKPTTESPSKRVKVDNSQSKDAPKQDS